MDQDGQVLGVIYVSGCNMPSSHHTWRLNRWRLRLADIVLLGAPIAYVLLFSPSTGAETNRKDAADVTSTETYFDFRNGHIPPEIRVLDRSGDYLRPDSEGLRIKLRKDDVLQPRVTLAADTSIASDFEITLTFDVLEAEEPPPDDSSFGVGILLAVNGYARIGWYAQPGRRVILWDRGGKRGQRVLDGETAPLPVASGRLRLSRTGKTVRFLWSRQRTGDDFDCVHEFDYPEAVNVVRLAAETNTLARNLDARFVDLRIRGGTVIAPRSATRTWLWMALIALLLMSILGGWTYARRHRRGLPEASPRERS
jgi:hypothetical protein